MSVLVWWGGEGGGQKCIQTFFPLLTTYVCRKGGRPRTRFCISAELVWRDREEGGGREGGREGGRRRVQTKNGADLRDLYFSTRQEESLRTTEARKSE